jgi:hypothetical protein
MPKRPERQTARARKVPTSAWGAATPVRNASPGWDDAVSTAAARINAGWILEETRCQQAAAELAVFMCAYKA